jgi:ribosomal protein S12 methylthiotransferase accessory factor
VTGTAKGFRDGTDRLVAPEVTLERLGPHLAALGITRVANITGLDVIGLPVVMACRPNSRSLSVSQGKGLTLAAAKASALMETIESYHAERVARPLLLGSADELRAAGHRVVDTAVLPAGRSGPFRPGAPALWVSGEDLATGEGVLVPHDAVHTDYTYEARFATGMLDISSNGLASGNSIEEAISHGICEVTERDASVWWRLRPAAARDATRIDPDTVDDPACR